MATAAAADTEEERSKASNLLTEGLQEVFSLPFASLPTYVKRLPDAQAKHQLRV